MSSDLISQEAFVLITEIASSLTLTPDVKRDLIAKIEIMNPKELTQMRWAYDEYLTTTRPIIEEALSRKTPQELQELEHLYDRMLTSAYRTVEDSITAGEQKEAGNILNQI